MLLVAGILILIDRGSRHQQETASQESGQGESTYSFAMGTSVCVTLYGADAQAYADLEAEVKRLDTEVISWRETGSALYTLNHSYEAGEAYVPEDTLYTALKQAYNICVDSEGALDITLRPLAELWNIEGDADTEFRVPSDEEIQSALGKTGYEQITFDDADRTITIAKPDMTLDLGAVGKGFALDVLCRRLKETDISGATISVGGSILIYGTKGDGAEFRIGIRNPKGTQDEMIGYLTFPEDANLCISTSGDYEKYKEIDGTRYHHILDRSTGYPADAGLSSVTVVCESGTYSDALSTACFVLGYERSLPLLETYNAEAIFIDHDNNITVTDGLKDSFRETEACDE